MSNKTKKLIILNNKIIIAKVLVEWNRKRTKYPHKKWRGSLARFTWG